VPLSAASIKMNATSVIGSKVIASPMITRSSTICIPSSRCAANAADRDAGLPDKEEREAAQGGALPILGSPSGSGR
jgi:hypothetical protein